MKLKYLLLMSVLTFNYSFAQEVTLLESSTGNIIRELDNKIIFAGPQISVSNGTNFGTKRIKDIEVKWDGKTKRQLIRFNDELYFFGNDYYEYAGGNGSHGIELWKTVGTKSGTVLLKDINPGKADGCDNTSYIVATDNFIMFVADDGIDKNALWKSNGTIEGTVKVKFIEPYAVYNLPKELTALNNIVIFSADSKDYGVELWRSDGTTNGTTLIKNINTNIDGDYHYGSSPEKLYVFNNEVYFVADNGSQGKELWKTDGTEDGTVIVKDINSGSESSNPSGFSIHNNEMYFAADDGNHGVELWKTDGTESGTILVKDLTVEQNGLGSRLDNSFLSYNNKLYFSARGGLWTTDGTTEGTQLFYPDLQALSLTLYNNEIYFFGGGSYGNLWKSNGVVDGTISVDDSATKISSFTISDSKLYFRGTEKNDINKYHLCFFYDTALTVENNDLPKIELFPNPIIDIININSDTGISTIDIYNQQGQLVLSSNKKQNINVYMLNSGIYIVKIITESGGIETQKIIKK